MVCEEIRGIRLVNGVQVSSGNIDAYEVLLEAEVICKTVEHSIVKLLD